MKFKVYYEDKILEMIKSKGEYTALGVDLAISRGWALEDIARLCDLYPTVDNSGYMTIMKTLRLDQHNYVYFNFHYEILIVDISVKGDRKEYDAIYNESVPYFYKFVLKFLKLYKKAYHEGN